MIRLATTDDLDDILVLYAAARRFMAQNGNPTQWGDTYPARELLEEDIRMGELFVDTQDGDICGVFVFTTRPEPTYAVIHDGAWMNDAPYGTIHRIASDGTAKGVFGRCVAFCVRRCPNLRIDTHHNNHAMRHLVQKHGFVRCGVITVADGSPRIAYQLPPCPVTGDERQEDSV